MPTAGEFEAMAAEFEDRADELDALPLDFVAALTPAVLVGPLVHAVDATFQVAARHLVTAGAVLRDVAALCRRRAARCREYTAAVDRYWAILRDPSRAFVPSPPVRAPWMEYGR